MFGIQLDVMESAAKLDLVRMAMPRRVYTQSQADYMIEVFEELHGKAKELKDLKIIRQAKAKCHFTTEFMP